MRKTVVFVVAAMIGATALAGPAMAQQSTVPAPSGAPAKGSVQLNVNTAINQSLVDKYVRDAPNVALAKCEGGSPTFSSPALTFSNYTPGPFMGADANISADAALKPGTPAGTYPLTVTCGSQTYSTRFSVPAPQVSKVPSGAAKAGDGSMAG
ncbi:hypothetical protein QRX60_06680 [Amycolatopsis mongoliensis]|uniref:Secreted protein n=1 Tax=Amycolatopsis mongoliensis TaxID=715475 RepID=A0A9Y2JTB0_9PSEU|nr:hypothetical protein [Amycolatopsis sp. 4-36]WIY03535.1 hypothetical protein QRX60_06680 [Amycolatopsis sp. 4-36]